MVVYRVLDYASAVLAEMFVRHEAERLLARFRDVVTLSGSFAVWVGLSVALCNGDFLAVWTKGRISWSPTSDWLMALLVISYSTTRCSVLFTGVTKQIGGMKYISLLEGLAFIGLSLAAAPRWGINGTIFSALVANILFTGVYGFWRTKRHFAIAEATTLLGWLRWPLSCLVCLAASFGAMSLVAHGWSTMVRLAAHATLAATVGAVLFWWSGLSPALKAEAWRRLSVLRVRLRG
jgi:hypothetical protein